MQCRLLYLIGQLGMGGAEQQLFYLLQAMDRTYYRPVVVTWNSSWIEPYGPRIQALGVPVYSFPGTRNAFEKLKRLRTLVQQLQPEVVHSYSFHTNFAAWWGTFGYKVLTFGSLRNNFLRERHATGKILGRLSARLPTAQICNSLSAKTNVKNVSSAFKPSRLYLVPNRLDIDRFQARWPLPTEPMLLAIGTLAHRKRWDRMLNVVAALTAKKLRFHVRHAGEGPLLQSLRSQATQLGISKMVEFLGPRTDVARLLADSTFLIHTADEEGFPNVVMEAMASGRAVVATDAGDVPCLVEDMITGFVVRRGDDETFVDRVAQLIIDRSLCLRMGDAGRLKAEREFSLGQLIEQTVAAYRAEGWSG